MNFARSYSKQSAIFILKFLSKDPLTPEIFIIDEYAIKIILYIMPCSMHMS